MTPNAMNAPAATSYRRRATTPTSEPRTSAATTMKSSRASLSFVPNRLAHGALLGAAGGLEGVDDDLADGRDERGSPPGRMPASNSEMPSAMAVATSPASGSGLFPAARRRGRDGRVRAVFPAGGAHRRSSRPGVTFACRRPRPRTAAPSLERRWASRRHGSGWSLRRTCIERTGGHRDAVRHHQGVRESRRISST